MGILLGFALKMTSASDSAKIDGKIVALGRRIKKIQRSITRTTNCIDRQHKALTNALKVEKNAMMQGLMAKAAEGLSAEEKSIFMGTGQLSGTSLSQEQNTNIATARTKYQQLVASLEQEFALREQRIEDDIEQMKEYQLEPLKDLEEELSQEKEQLEEERELNKKDAELAKGMVSEGFKNLYPNYS